MSSNIDALFFFRFRCYMPTPPFILFALNAFFCTQNSFKMYLLSQFLSAFCIFIITALSAHNKPDFPSSPKRGLVFTPDPAHSSDDKIWVESGSDLTWYYNYGWTPSPQFAKIPQSKFEYVPMIWGAPSSTSDLRFVNAVEALIKGGRNITHVLAFNEPDMIWQWGGSDMTPSAAAQAWEQEIVPLQKMGIKVGAPALAIPGLAWLQNFTLACPSCYFDFIPLHFYGDHNGLEWHVNEIHTA
jgi:Glycosyl hydrolase catalytic core